MDYTSGTDLVKHQWDAIHDPGLVIGIFEKDEEGASMALDLEMPVDSIKSLIIKSIRQILMEKIIWTLQLTI